MSALLADVAATQRGLQTPLEVRRRILDTVERLAAASAGSTTATDAALSGTWRLLWTTERETLWILANARLFATRAGEVYQVLWLWLCCVCRERGVCVSSVRALLLCAS